VLWCREVGVWCRTGYSWMGPLCGLCPGHNASLTLNSKSLSAVELLCRLWLDVFIIEGWLWRNRVAQSMRFNTRLNWQREPRSLVTIFHHDFLHTENLSLPSTQGLYFSGPFRGRTGDSRYVDLLIFHFYEIDRRNPQPQYFPSPYIFSSVVKINFIETFFVVTAFNSAFYATLSLEKHAYFSFLFLSDLPVFETISWFSLILFSR